MAAWALAEYRFRGNTLLGLYLAIGIMVPIRLGTVSILKMMVDARPGQHADRADPRLHRAWACRSPSSSSTSSSSRSRATSATRRAATASANTAIFFAVILPLIRPALATVAVFTMVPIWNDLWFPLILAPGRSTQTVTLGVQQFIGQYVTDWNAVLSSLSLAIAPILVLYMIFSRSLVRGLTAGSGEMMLAGCRHPMVSSPTVGGSGAPLHG